MPEKDFSANILQHINDATHADLVLKDAERIYGAILMKRLYCTLMEGTIF